MSSAVSLLMAFVMAFFLKKKRILNACYLALTVLIIFLITLIVKTPIFFDTTIITAVDKKNDMALSTEVFLSGISINNKFSAISEANIEDGEWFWLDGNRYCWRPESDERRIENITSSISLHLPIYKRRFLVFDTNPWQGLVEINGVLYDLYSETPNAISIPLLSSSRFSVINNMFECSVYCILYLSGFVFAKIISEHLSNYKTQFNGLSLSKERTEFLILFFVLFFFCLFGIIKYTKYPSYYDYSTTLLLVNSEFSYTSRGLIGNILGIVYPYISKSVVDMIKWGTWTLLYGIISYSVAKVATLQKTPKSSMFLIAFVLCQPALFLQVHDDLRTDAFLIIFFIISVILMAFDRFTLFIPLIAVFMLLINETACLCFVPQIIMLLLYKFVQEKKAEYIFEVFATVCFTIFLSFYTIIKGRASSPFTPDQILQHMNAHTNIALSADPLHGLSLNFSSILGIWINYISEYKWQILLFVLFMLPMLFIIVFFSYFVFKALLSKYKVNNFILLLLILSSLSPMSSTLVSVDFPRYITFSLFSWFSIIYFLIYKNKIQINEIFTKSNTAFLAFQTYKVEIYLMLFFFLYLLFGEFDPTIPYIPSINKIYRIARSFLK